MDHGFSFSIPKKKEETFKQPPKDRPTILAIFVNNPDQVDKLVSAKWVVNNDNVNQSEPMTLEKVEDNLYVTEPIKFPDEKFKIIVDGLDDENHTVVWVSPPKFQSIDTSNY